MYILNVCSQQHISKTSDKPQNTSTYNTIGPPFVAISRAEVGDEDVSSLLPVPARFSDSLVLVYSTALIAASDIVFQPADALVET
jgi:hypothetical protein